MINPARLGEKIETLRALNVWAQARSSTISDYFVDARPLPAAVVMNMTGVTILKILQKGLYIYNPPAKGRNRQWSK